jgi:AcrR family transcriptional regulator
MSPGAGRPYAEASRSLLREMVLRATDDLLTRHPWKDVAISQVAKAAGVSRQTVYNEFGNRADLARAYAAWAGDQLLDEVERCVAEHRDDLLDALLAAFTVFLDLGAEHPLVRSLSDRSGADDLVAALNASQQDNPIITGAVVRLAGIITTTWPGLTTEAVAAPSEVLVRLAISHLLQPTTSSEAAAQQVAVVLAPYLAELQASVAPRPRRRKVKAAPE